MKPPEYPKKGVPVEQTINEIIDYLKAMTVKSFEGGKIKESRQGITLSVLPRPNPLIPDQTIDPFYPTLQGNAENGYKLTMAPGYVILRHKETSDSVEHIVPTSIPDETAVSVGNKITCLIEEDGAGLFTTASIEIHASAWPTSIAPTLKGGDDATGVAGERHIRLCEIVQDTDVVEVKIWNTGHIDHFAPELIENATASGSAVLKEFDASTGAWILRRLFAGTGITITQNADNIEVEETPDSGAWATFDFSNVDGATIAGFEFENGKLKQITGSGSGFSLTGTGTEADPFVGSMVTDQ